MSRQPRKTIDTVWEIRTYDVWGNAQDGFEVNNSFDAGEINLRLKIETHNVGTPHEFQSASPSDRQIQDALGVTCAIETDGDDLNVYVNRARDGYPLGELFCTSHESLSPIRKVENK